MTRITLRACAGLVPALLLLAAVPAAGWGVCWGDPPGHFCWDNWMSGITGNTYHCESFGAPKGRHVNVPTVYWPDIKRQHIADVSMAGDVFAYRTPTDWAYRHLISWAPYDSCFGHAYTASMPRWQAYYHTFAYYSEASTGQRVFAGNVVPRDVNRVGILASHAAYEYGVESWGYSFINPYGQTVYTAAVTFNRNGLEPNRWYFQTTDGTPQNGGVGTWDTPAPFRVILGMPVSCSMPTGVYTIRVNWTRSPYPIQHGSFWFVLGEGPGCPQSTPTPTPTPRPRNVATPTPTPAPTVTPTPTPSAAPSEAPAVVAPRGCESESSPVFSWSKVGGASSYDLVIEKGTATVYSENVTTTSKQVGGLAQGVKHRWKVRARNIHGTSGWSESVEFTPGCGSAIGEVPVPIAPNDATNCVATDRPTFSWQPVPGAHHYYLYVQDKVTGGNVIHEPNVTGESYPAPLPLARGRAYFWRVKGVTATGTAGSYSATANFCVSEPPAKKQTTMRPNCRASRVPVPSAVGRPVSVTSGNMFLDQVDVTVAGVGPALVFSRSYNSANDEPGGLLGPGWTHSLERAALR